MILQGKVAAITGASRGIGQAGAFAFAREGAKVVIAGRSDKDGEYTVREIKRRGGEATFVRTDASLVSDMENLIRSTVKTYGKLDIFWHNAGIFFSGHIDLVKDDEFDKQMATNLKGAVFGTKFAIREMRKIGGGVILFTSSMVGLRPNPYHPNYSLTYGLTKAGLVMLARCLTDPLIKDNIRVNCLCPGPVRTPNWEDAQRRIAQEEGITFEETLQRSNARLPINRAITMEEVADAALYLASDKAAGITGVAFPIDGGFSAL